MVIAVGVGFLIGAAILIGQRRAQDHAWEAISRERRRLHETRRALDSLTDDLTEEGLRLQEWEARLVIATERTRPSGEIDLGRA